jgi:curli biogenesis system outer membrane secretion channel CsgG
MPKQKSSRAGVALLTALIAATSLSGASAASRNGDYAPVLGDAPATRNPTPYSAALACLASHRATTRLPRISVGRVSDLTGKVDYDTGAKISQGASLFTITALGKAGFPVVERLDNSVAEIELNYSRQHLLSDNPQLAGQSPDNYRRIYAGQIAGSSYYIVGGVTELNYNIRSSGVAATVGNTAATGVRGNLNEQSYVLNVAIDLRLVNSRTQEVVDTVSYQKQLIGKSLNLGLNGGGDKVGATLSGGRSSMEPIQAAVRTLVERGVFDLTAGFYGQDIKTACLNPASEPQGPTPASLAYQTPGYEQAR